MYAEIILCDHIKRVDDVNLPKAIPASENGKEKTTFSELEVCIKTIFIPRRMRRRVTVVILCECVCVCLSVCYRANCYIPCLYVENRVPLGFHDDLNTCIDSCASCLCVLYKSADVANTWLNIT